jgi:hypothetical protein
MNTFQVYGSRGDLTVSSVSGRVLFYEPISDGEYRSITFFNIADMVPDLSRRSPPIISTFSTLAIGRKRESTPRPWRIGLSPVLKTPS